MFAISVEVLENATVALFAAFGAIALLMLVEFGGRMRNRLEAQAALSLAGAVLICLGTVASHAVWSAVLSMLIVAFIVIFLGVVSSVFAIATTALLLVFILPVGHPRSRLGHSGSIGWLGTRIGCRDSSRCGYCGHRRHDRRCAPTRVAACRALAARTFE